MTFRSEVTFLSPIGSPQAIAQALASLRGLTSSRWEWCILDDSPPRSPLAREVSALVATEPRAVLVPVPGLRRAEAANVGLSRATSDFIAWLPAGSILDPNSIEAARPLLGGHDWIYTDEGRLDAFGTVTDIHFKPDWSPELFRSQPYAANLSLVRREAIHPRGGFRPEAGVAFWYDLLLRLAETGVEPAHLAGPYLLHPEGSAPYLGGVSSNPEDEVRDRCAVVAEHCARSDISVESVSNVVVQERPIGQRLHRTRSSSPKVSVIVPTCGTTSEIYGLPRTHVVEMVRSLLAGGYYPALELVVVYDRETPSEALDALREIAGDLLVLVEYSGEFHFSRKCNLGAMKSTGQVVAFLNDDMEIIDDSWLDELVSLLEDENVGAVGARLLYADGTLQHAGHVYSRSMPHHLLLRQAPDVLELGGTASLVGERSGVTGACLAMRREVFEQVGGFSDLFALNFNDVDLCLKVRGAGYRILYTPFSTLYHYESQARVPGITDEELRLIRGRWEHALEVDPYLNELIRSDAYFG